jgi:hypothetical protein
VNQHHGVGSCRYSRLPNVAYDGRFTFVRAEYARYGGWAADYPAMETNLNTILRDITELRPHDGGTNVFTFDDAELYRFPISYLSELSHPIFNTFFQIKSLRVPYPGRLGEQGLMGEFFGIHEQNDPTRPLQVIINYNIDLGDYVEWSAENLYNKESTNEAYKFMVNYVIYGLTH